MTLWVHICILYFKIWYCNLSYYYSCLSASYITPWGSELVIRGLFIATHPHQLLFITLSQCPRYCFVISKRKWYRVSCLRSLVFSLISSPHYQWVRIRPSLQKEILDFTLCLHLHISRKKNLYSFPLQKPVFRLASSSCPNIPFPRGYFRFFLLLTNTNTCKHFPPKFSIMPFMFVFFMPNVSNLTCIISALI